MNHRILFLEGTCRVYVQTNRNKKKGGMIGSLKKRVLWRNPSRKWFGWPLTFLNVEGKHLWVVLLSTPFLASLTLKAFMDADFSDENCCSSVVSVFSSDKNSFSERKHPLPVIILANEGISQGSLLLACVSFSFMSSSWVNLWSTPHIYPALMSGVSRRQPGCHLPHLGLNLLVKKEQMAAILLPT